MDLLLKALATAAVVAALILLMRRAGPRVAGLAAALPVTSAPVLAWLGQERGAGPAGEAAAAALLTTALTPLGVLVYGRLSARQGPLACLAAGLAAGVAGGMVLSPLLGADVGGRLAVGLGLGLLALFALPRPAPAPWRRPDARAELALTCGVAALLTGLAGALVDRIGAGGCGLFAAVPVVGLTLLINLHRGQGADAACRFLAGYLNGIAAKVVFLAVLCLALPVLPQPLAWAVAAAGGLLTLLLAGARRSGAIPLPLKGTTP